MPMKLECMSFVCRMVKVFFPSTAADSPPGRRIVTPTAVETARNSRREIVSRDIGVKVSLPSAAAIGFLSLVFIDAASLFLDWLLHPPGLNHYPAGATPVLFSFSSGAVSVAAVVGLL